MLYGINQINKHNFYIIYYNIISQQIRFIIIKEDKINIFNIYNGIKNYDNYTYNCVINNTLNN